MCRGKPRGARIFTNIEREDESYDVEEIVLPSGQQVPPRAGRFRVTPPPHLRDFNKELFYVEYDYPELIVRDAALRVLFNLEREEAQYQIYQWEQTVGDKGGIAVEHCGYALNWSSSPGANGYLQQFVPEFSFVDASTWSSLSKEEEDMAYLPCVPAVVLHFTTDVDTMEILQTKTHRFVCAGTREGVVVDISGERVWIHNRGEKPHFEALGVIEFDSWPGFTLDCGAILAYRERERRRLGL
ncbi:unnamed protein product [Phytophthora fragariaefolia]|uniref:Unnamed protein product n=1 Tax=Phytophthora fragariaefolia TaxID=1490495 RepID=A0A9W6Y215_9STRA|nr:unnamed protein product [Phytophthora fragariaefolia]